MLVNRFGDLRDVAEYLLCFLVDVVQGHGVCLARGRDGRVAAEIHRKIAIIGAVEAATIGVPSPAERNGRSRGAACRSSSLKMHCWAKWIYIVHYLVSLRI